MQKLTKAESQVMHFIWTLGECMVSEILEQFEAPKPPHSTISSVVRILEKKGFVTHKAYGRTHVYRPIVTQDEYRRFTLQHVKETFFGGSSKALVSFLVQENELDLNDLTDLLDDLAQSDRP